MVRQKLYDSYILLEGVSLVLVEGAIRALAKPEEDV